GPQALGDRYPAPPVGQWRAASSLHMVKPITAVFVGSLEVCCVSLPSSDICVAALDRGLSISSTGIQMPFSSRPHAIKTPSTSHGFSSEGGATVLKLSRTSSTSLSRLDHSVVLLLL